MKQIIFITGTGFDSKIFNVKLILNDSPIAHPLLGPKCRRSKTGSGNPDCTAWVENSHISCENPFQSCLFDFFNIGWNNWHLPCNCWNGHGLLSHSLYSTRARSGCLFMLRKWTAHWCSRNHISNFIQITSRRRQSGTTKLYFEHYREGLTTSQPKLGYPSDTGRTGYRDSTRYQYVPVCDLRTVFNPFTEYFQIDKNTRAPFQYGLCLYLCWAIMVIYGVGSSLYIFSGFY